MIAPKLPDHLLTVYRIEGVNALIPMLRTFDGMSRWAYECPVCEGKGRVGAEVFTASCVIPCLTCDESGRVQLDLTEGLSPFDGYRDPT